MRLSVIVTLYNREEFIGRCIESVLRCPWDDMELIIVDDGSNDNSAHICKDYAQKDSRINYIYQDNAWISAARNKGISVAKGNYIMFCDDDDFFADNWWEHIEKSLATGDYDVVFFDYCRANLKGEIITEYNVFPSHPDWSDLYNVYLSSYKLSAVCGKLFKRKTIEENDLSFDINVRYAEDSLFIGNFIRKLTAFNYVDEVIYMYTDNPVSIVKQSALHIREMVMSLQNKYNLIKEKGEDVCNLTYKAFFSSQYKEFITYLRVYSQKFGYKDFSKICEVSKSYEAFNKMFDYCYENADLRRKWQINMIRKSKYFSLYALFCLENLFRKFKGL